MGKMRVGFVGVSRGAGLVRTFRNNPRAEVSAVCDLDNSALAELGKDLELPDNRLFSSYEKMLASELDMVVIATPIEFHVAQSIQALESGKHVLCEQTVAYTVQECEALIDTVRRTGLSYMMAENYCYYHYIRQWREIIAAGRLGSIFHAEGEYIHEIEDLLVDPLTGKRQWRYTRPPIWYCAHTLGPILMLMDDRIVKATGLHGGKHIRPEEEGIGYLDMEVGLFQTEKGSIIKILRSQVARRYGKDHCEMVWYSLYGTKGFIESGREGGVDSVGRLFLEGEMDKEKGAREIRCPHSDDKAPAHARIGGHGTSEYYMVNEFLDSIENGTQPPIDAIRAAEFTIPGLIAHESAMRGGVWIEVPQYHW